MFKCWTKRKKSLSAFGVISHLLREVESLILSQAVAIMSAVLRIQGVLMKKQKKQRRCLIRRIKDIIGNVEDVENLVGLTTFGVKVVSHFLLQWQRIYNGACGALRAVVTKTLG
jgi:predicted small integral membrane protein